ncbi:esterase family protein [Niveibacterium sp. 24ML]|uniref:alpha/beta hydrolase n=1 Tax=Niveibacterium sp. 24ML TaxID=2985512 RepID=UPI002270A786|nr:alpha/beta hydrolase-fold protein [Niveibacterium sp. 24ML]MCX9154650.1 esterase family protein [Niveibacterium sp. 24ML]
MNSSLPILSLAALCALGLSLFQAEAQAAGVQAKAGANASASTTPNRLMFEEMQSQAVNDGALKDGPTRYFSVYLPPSYFDEPERRFPVVYYLHGFGGGMGFLAYFKDVLDAEMRKPDVTPFIVIEADGTNSLRGSFYVNSAASGRWEDHIVQELVGWADARLRTIAAPEGRGIAGASMGGFGAIHLGLRYPDVYQSVLAFAPGLVAPGQIKAAWDSWNTEIKRAYGAAFSPNPALPRPHAEIPVFDGSPDDQRIVANWERGFGAPQEKIDAYLAQAARLKSIQIVVGKDDEHDWIVRGSKAFSGLLSARGIEHRLELIEASHAMPTDFPAKFMVPQFSSAFAPRK